MSDLISRRTTTNTLIKRFKETDIPLCYPGIGRCIRLWMEEIPEEKINMGNYVSINALAEILCDFYPEASESEKNMIIKIFDRVKKLPPASVMKVQTIPRNPDMERLLRDAGRE